ncbi:hypothetical protein [Kitasatospora sp. NPDC017646]
MCLSCGPCGPVPRHYGTIEEHLRAYGLDAASLRERIAAQLW